MRSSGAGVFVGLVLAVAVVADTSLGAAQSVLVVALVTAAAVFGYLISLPLAVRIIAFGDAMHRDH